MKSKFIAQLVIAAVAVVVLFVMVSIQVETHIDFFNSIFSMNLVLGAVIYILLSIISVVIAPITTIPLIPLASHLYGWPLAALFSIIGEFIGSIIAFFIGRRYGKSFIGRFVSLKRAGEIEKLIPKKHLFWGVISLRILIPLDLVSYALAIFTKVSYKFFIVTAILGIVPVFVYLAYAGTLSLVYQIVALAAGILIIVIGLIILFRKRR